MTTAPTKMIDVVFEVSGETLPISYPYALWEEIIKLVPQLLENENVGVIPLRGAHSKEGMLLPKRAKLILRLPHELVDAVSILAQKQLQVDDCLLQLGASKHRPIEFHPTLHAHMVTGADDEVEFMAWVEETLGAMGVKANLICGQRHELTVGPRVIKGYSLVLHDLSHEASLRVQYAGLGRERRFGCGIFLPHKAISSAD